jgi:hypothetical protein
MRAKHELKKKNDVLGWNQKNFEKAKEALAAAAAAQDEATASVTEATAALTKASQEYAKIMPEGGPPAGANDEELNAKSPEELHAMLTEAARRAELASLEIKKLRAIVERNEANRIKNEDIGMAEAKEAETKRNDEQSREDAATKRRTEEDSNRAKAQLAAAAREATYEAERAAASAATAAAARAKAKSSSK